MFKSAVLCLSISLGFSAAAAEVVTKVIYTPKERAVTVLVKMSDDSYVPRTSPFALQLKKACIKKLDEVVSLVKDADVLKSEEFCTLSRAPGFADYPSIEVESSTGSLFLRFGEISEPLINQYFSDCLEYYSTGDWINSVKAHAKEICLGTHTVADFVNRG